VVTRADQACEELIRERLLGARPDDAFFGEESSETEGHDDTGSSGIRWVVDPIDGTVNYLYGLPHYAVSIAAMQGDQVLAGVVHAPALEVEYVATAGGGATRNGVPVPQREAPALDKALVASGYSYEQSIRAHQAGAVARMLPQVRDIRRIGSCALDLCAVADGSLDAYVEEGPHLWDHAAAGLVATESGGRIEVWPTPRGKELVLCAPLAMWPEFDALVRACGFL
jgi:myo-inositol-1(or 4)-monophosphatase